LEFLVVPILLLPITILLRFVMMAPAFSVQQGNLVIAMEQIILTWVALVPHRFAPAIPSAAMYSGIAFAPTPLR